MKRLLLAFALLLLVGFTNAVEFDQVSMVDGFSKIKIGDVIAYTHPSLLNAPQLLATDKIFYGSSSGSINIKIYLSDQFTPTSKKYKIGLDMNKSNVTVTRVKFDTEDALIKNPVAQKDFIYSTKFDVSSDLHEIEIELEFDPNEIGMSEKFDIVLYDSFGNEVLRLDPFLSGFEERRALNIESTHSEITTTYTHQFEEIDTTAWACADNTSLAIGWHGTGGNPIEIDVDINGTIGSSGVGLFWRSQTNIPINTGLNGTDTNGYFAYCDTSVRGSPLRDRDNAYLLYEDFEDLSAGNLATQNNWTGSTLWQVVGSGCNTGSQCASATPDGAEQFGTKAFSSIDAGVLAVSMKNTFSATTPYVATRLHDGVGEKTRLYMRASGTDMGIFDGSTVTYTESTPDDAWRSFEMDFNSGSQSSKILNGSSAGETITRTKVMSDIQEVNIQIADASSSGTIWFDDLKIFEKLSVNPLYTLGSVEIAQADFNLTFNVFQGTGIDTHLTNLTIDFNVDIYDASGLTSPFTIIDVNAGDYLITISKNEWDINTFVLTVDANKTETIYIDRFIYPNITQFERTTSFVSSSINYQTIETFQYTTSFGASSTADTGCSFWVATNNVAERTVTFRFQTSEDGTIWTDRAERSRTFAINELAGSMFIQTPDFNISDGNHFFRVQQKRDGGANFDMNSNSLVCANFIHRDQNNFLFPITSDSITDLTTSNTEFELVRTINAITEQFNGFLYHYGDAVYRYGVTGGTGVFLFGLNGVPDSNTAEYPRTTSANTIGVGGQSGIFQDLNSLTTYAVETFMKTTAGTFILDYIAHTHNLNQKVGDFAEVDLNGISTSANDFEIVKSIDLNLSETQSDLRVIATLPFNCTENNCLIEGKLQVKNTTFDMNSAITIRATNGIGSIGVGVLQYVFEDVNATDVNVNLWLQTDKGTITLQGGSLSVVRTNLSATLLPNPPQDPLVFAPINGSTVSGSAVDFNCFTVDPNGDTLVYDVNIINRDTNTLALNLQSTGDGNGTFDSTVLSNNTYSIDCTATESGTVDSFRSTFDNALYSFIIDNPNAPTVTVNLPNGGEIFNSSIVGAIDINFTINDVGSGSWLVDLNFGTIGTQGTGTPIVNDLNTQLAGITCVGSSGVFDCIVSWDITSVPAGDYFILVSATDEDDLIGFDSSNASFEIVVVPPGEGYERYFNPLDDRKDLTDQNKFVNPELVENESGVIRTSNEQNLLLMGILILLVVLILIVIFVVFFKRGK